VPSVYNRHLKLTYKNAVFRSHPSNNMHTAIFFVPKRI